MKKEFFITIKTGEGRTQTTAPFKYDPSINFSKINQKLHFAVDDPRCNLFFDIDILYINMITKKVEASVSETIHINKMLATDSISCKTTCGLTAKLGMFVEVSDEFSDFLPEKGFIRREKSREKSIEDVFSTEGFSMAKMKYLYEAMVNGLTPIVQAQEAIVDFLNWKDPHKTFFCSIILTFVMLHFRYSIILGFIILFLFDKQILFTLINRANLNTNPDVKINQHKKNMRFVKQLLKSHSIAYDYYARLFKSDDKTLLIKNFLQIKQYAPYAIPVLLFVRFRYMLILGFWGYLIYNTTVGETYIMSIISKANKFYIKYKGKKCCDGAKNEKSMNKSVTLTKPNFVKKDSGSTNGSRSPLLSDASTDVGRFSFPDVSTPKNNGRKMSFKEKVFVIYENQRWWLGQGWKEELLPGERPSWSDETGTIELNKDNIQLPNDNWSWDNEWNYIVSTKTDEEGYEYASRFRRFADPDRKPSSVNWVRRRKWVRKCVGYDDATEGTA